MGPEGNPPRKHFGMLHGMSIGACACNGRVQPGLFAEMRYSVVGHRQDFE